MPKKIHTEGLDELVALDVTVVITKDKVVLQVAPDNEEGRSRSDAYKNICNTPSDGGNDGWITAKVVDVIKPGGLNFARDWFLFSKFLNHGSFVAVREDSITLNYYIDNSKEADDLYTNLKSLGVTAEMNLLTNFNWLYVRDALTEIPIDTPVSVTKMLGGGREVFSIEVTPSRDDG